MKSKTKHLHHLLPSSKNKFTISFNCIHSLNQSFNAKNQKCKKINKFKFNKTKGMLKVKKMFAKNK